MKTFFAANAAFSAVLPPLHVRSRDTAIAAALGDEDQVAVHEQVVDPLIYRAASELIRLDDDGQKTDIEAQGPVYDVLQSVEEQLVEAGASTLAALQILETLKTYVSGLGADFARKAKAKPLYARIMVTSKEPEDMPDCKLSSLTCIDGQRIQGDDAGQMSMTLTLYGTSNAMSQGMSMQRVFESGKKKWLMIYYGTIEGADLNKFDTVDADLATLIQAVGAGGGGSVEEIRAAIENGTLAPEVKELIAAIAELNRTVEASRTPGAVENPAAKIAELKAAIAEIAQSIPDMQALPQVLVQAVAESIARVDMAPEAPAVETSAEASNDNDTVMEQTESVLEQITALLQDEALPPEMKENLTVMAEKIDAAMGEKDFAGLQTAMVEVRGALVEMAASDAIPPQMFRSISEILPAIVIAEKQLGDVVPVPVSVESVPDVANLELAENVAEIKQTIAEKIEVLLQDEALPPEMKERLAEIVRTIGDSVEQKDFAKLVIATTEMRQTLADFAAKDVLPPQIAKQIAEILPAVASSEQKLADVVPRAQAENILVALIATEQKLQSGEISTGPETVALVQALDTLKEAIKEQGPDAALQKIVESIKAPAAEGAIVPALDVLAKNPVLLQVLPPELGQALAQAVPPVERSIQQHLAVAGIVSMAPASASEKIVDVLLAVEKHIGLADIKADPAKAELAKVIADLKETIKQEGLPAAVQKIGEAMQQVSVDGKAAPIFEMLAAQPALLAALPVELQTNVQLLKETSVLTNIVVTQQAQKMVDVVVEIDRQIHSGAIDKTANPELAKIVADIKETIKQDGSQAAVEKISEALKQVAVDGKTPPILEVLAAQPSVLAALPPEIRTSIEQIQQTITRELRTSVQQLQQAASIAPSPAKQAEQIIKTVEVISQKIESGAIDRAANQELAKVVADLKETIRQGGTSAAVEKITEALKQATIDGKAPPIIEALTAQPALLSVLPPQLRSSIEQVQQTVMLASAPAKLQAEKIVDVVVALDQHIKSGAIDKSNTEVIKIVADIKQAMEQGGKAAAVEKITEALKQVSVDGKMPPIIEALASQPALLEKLPSQLRSNIEQVHQTVIATITPVKQAQQIVDAIKIVEQKIESGATDKASPANADLVKAVTEIKEAIRQGGTQAAVEKVTEALKQVPLEGKAPLIVAAIAVQPAVLAALPQDVRGSIEKVQQMAAVVAVPVAQQVQAVTVQVPFATTPQPEKIVQVVDAIQQGIQSGTINKADPANAAVIKAIEGIQQSIGKEGVQGAVQKFSEMMQATSVDGKMPPVIEALAENPAVVATLPPAIQQTVAQFERTVVIAATPVREHAEKMVVAIAALDKVMQSGALPKADQSNPALTAAIAEIKQAIRAGGTEAAVLKINEGIKQAMDGGKMPPVIAAVLQQPSVLNALPPQARMDIQAVQQKIQFASAVEAPARPVVQAFAVVEQSIRSGAVQASPETKIAIAEIKAALQKDGAKALFTEIDASIKAVEPRAVQMATVLAKPEILKTLPPEVQKEVLNFQRTVFEAEARNTVIKNQTVAIDPTQQRTFQALAEKANLPPADAERFRREIQAGQIRLETATKILDMAERQTASAEIAKARSEIGALSVAALAKSNTVVTLPPFEPKTVGVIAKLPVPVDSATRLAEGRVTKADIVAVQLAVGPAPTKEQKVLIEAVIKPVLQQQSRSAVAAFDKAPVPPLPKPVIDNMREGKPITQAQYRTVMENPKVSVETKKAVHTYVAAQLEIIPPRGTPSVAQTQQVFTANKAAPAIPPALQEKTAPLVRPQGIDRDTRKVWTAPVTDSAPKTAPKEVYFQPTDKEAFKKIIETAKVDSKDKPVVDAIMRKVEAGEPLPRSDMNDLTRVARMPQEKHLELSANVLPVPIAKNDTDVKNEQAKTCCSEGCDPTSPCKKHFNTVSPAEIKKTADPLIGDFANYKADTTAENANPSRTEKTAESELKDFLEPKEEKPRTCCSEGCDPTSPCKKHFNTVNHAEIKKTADPLIGDFKNYGMDSLPKKTLTVA